MMHLTINEIHQEIDRLDYNQLKQLATFISFLKFQTNHSPVSFLSPETAQLYEDFAEEDRQLAEMGMTDYFTSLAQEDSL
jgi:hypothetical protein